MHRLICRGYTDVVDADLSRYFDSIPHADLMKSIARRIVDRHVLRLVKIPKLNGEGERPLGILTIRDRVIQTAAKIVLEPIFEADFEDRCGSGLRSRNATTMGSGVLVGAGVTRAARLRAVSQVRFWPTFI